MLKFAVVRTLFMGILAMLMLLDVYWIDFSYLWYVLPILGFLGLIIIGSYYIKWEFFIDTINSGNPLNQQIAITFDDGPDPIHTPKVLDLLDKYDAKATFFCIGDKVQQHGEVVTEIHRRGHTLGNHSFSHNYAFPMFSTQRIVAELMKTNQLIEQVTGVKMIFFRPPFGVTNPRIARAVKRMAMQVVGWNIRSFDTASKNSMRVVNRINRQLQNGAIILLHDDREEVDQILEGVLLQAKQQQLQCVTIAELLD